MFFIGDRITILGTGAKWIATLEDRDIRPSKKEYFGTKMMFSILCSLHS